MMTAEPSVGSHACSARHGVVPKTRPMTVQGTITTAAGALNALPAVKSPQPEQNPGQSMMATGTDNQTAADVRAQIGPQLGGNLVQNVASGGEILAAVNEAV